MASGKERGRESRTPGRELRVLFERGNKDGDFYLCELVDPMLVAGPTPRGVPLAALPLGGRPNVWMHTEQLTPQRDLFRIVEHELCWKLSEETFQHEKRSRDIAEPVEKFTFGRDHDIDDVGEWARARKEHDRTNKFWSGAGKELGLEATEGISDHHAGLDLEQLDQFREIPGHFLDRIRRSGASDGATPRAEQVTTWNPAATSRSTKPQTA